MKSLFKSISMLAALMFLAACSSDNSAWKRLSASELDQKSYAIAYGATAQTYEDRVNETYDINSFIKGVDDWYSKRVTLPVEQIRAMTTNLMLDHNVYAYYSGVLYAAELQGKFNYLDPNCWGFVQTPSMTQGIFDAMNDLQKNKVKDDEFIRNGVDQILHLCVKTMAEDKPAETKKSAKAKKQK